jgi:hypothetical protein
MMFTIKNMIEEALNLVKKRSLPIAVIPDVYSISERLPVWTG